MKYLISSILFLAITIDTTAMTISCGEIENYIKQADIVFVGTVIARENIEEKNSGICWTIEQGSNCGSKVATFRVEELVKGNDSNITTVFAGDGCYCLDPYIEKDRKYIVFGTKSGDRAAYKSMNVCATRPFSEQSLSEIKSVE